MSSLEEISKLPGYDSAGAVVATICVAIKSHFEQPSQLPQSGTSFITLISSGGGTACVTGQPPAMDSRAGSRRNRCRSIDYQLYRAARPRQAQIDTG